MVVGGGGGGGGWWLLIVDGCTASSSRWRPLPLKFDNKLRTEHNLMIDFKGNI
jgi:hypothetical protein